MRPLLIAFALLLVAAVASVAPATEAQDRTEDRLAALETVVAELQTRVEGGALPVAPGNAARGLGDTVLAPLDILPGTTIFRGSCDTGPFSLTVYSREERIAVPISSRAAYEGSTVEVIRGAGPFALVVACAGNWTVNVAPFPG